MIFFLMVYHGRVYSFCIYEKTKNYVIVARTTNFRKLFSSRSNSDFLKKYNFRFRRFSWCFGRCGVTHRVYIWTWAHDTAPSLIHSIHFVKIKCTSRAKSVKNLRRKSISEFFEVAWGKTSRIQKKLREISQANKLDFIKMPFGFGKKDKVRRKVFVLIFNKLLQNIE